MSKFNLKDKAKEFGSGILGILMFLGFCILPFIFIFGALKVSEILYPIISVLSSASILIFILIILPLSLFKKLQGHLAGLSLILSYIVGASVFMASFLTIFYYLGWIAIFFMFMFHLVAPIAAIGLFFKGQWLAGFAILLGVAFTFGMRFYGIWLSAKMEDRESSNYIEADVIDVDANSNEEEFEDVEQIESPEKFNDQEEPDDVKYED